MYSLEQTLTGVRNPHRAAQELNNLFAERILERFRPRCRVFDEDWDNLLILDGCRHDVLQDYDVEQGRLEYRWSGGSNSREFLKYNVAGRTLDDVVWVTANPWVSTYDEHIFHVENLWNAGWDQELKTVRPETVAETSERLAEKYPQKRLVVHFMQPHYPFVGETGRSELPNHRTFTGDGMIKDLETTGKDIWEHLKEGTVAKDVVWKAYRENLELVLPYAKRLASDLEGKSVLTSDHGNEFGGRCFPIPLKLYGHPGGYRTKNLIKVPWVVFDSNQRRTIEASAEMSEENGVTANLNERLADLGYRSGPT